MKDNNSITVAIVDDDAPTRERIQDLFKEGDPTITVNGYASLEALKAQPVDFDALLLDLNLPGYDGMDTLNAAREFIGKNTPIIIFTGTQPYQFGIDALNEGADHFLSKNHWSDEDILNKVQEVTRQSRQIEEFKRTVQS